MNKICLKGKIRNIQYSHEIKGIEYDKAELVVEKKGSAEPDVLPLCFKKFTNIYTDDQVVELEGNIRSYSHQTDNKNKVDIYVFTYFNIPENCEEEIVNDVEIDGRVCKVDELRTTRNGKQNFHFILANNIISNDGKQKLNNYIPCVCWGKLALEYCNLQINDVVKLKGQLHSRLYKKQNDGEVEIKTAYELVVREIEHEKDV